MGYVVQKRSNFGAFSETKPCTITIPSVTLNGFCSKAVYKNPHPKDEIRKGETHTVFYMQSNSKKVFLPSPPFKGNQGFEDEIGLKDLLKISKSDA